MIPLLDLKFQMSPLRNELHEALNQILENTDFVSGKAVSQFENEFSKFIGTKKAIACANGTDAITLALKALGVTQGDRILTVSHTFIASASAILHAGGVPDFVDVDLSSELLSASLLEKHLTMSKAKGIQYRGLVVVHLRGNPCPMDEIMEIAKKNDLFVLEDAAQAHGTSYKGKKVGTFGDAATFSFFPGKNLGALGDAGAVVTNSPEIAQRVSMLRDHGRKEKYVHETIGYNSRMDTLQAAFLTIKLRHLNDWNEGRRKVAQLYLKYLKETPHLEMVSPIQNGESIYHHFAIRCQNRDKLLETLKKEGIHAGVHYPVPVHLQPAFQKLKLSTLNLPNTEIISKTTLSLPIYPELAESQVKTISQIVRNHCETNGP